jgi:serine/threonine protein phosphatase 1
MDRTARLPEGIRLYAVGDVHGRADLLQQTFDAIDKDRCERPSDQIIEVYLGDYIDRGPHSALVIEKLISRSAKTHILTLCGNHELYLIKALENHQFYERWRPVGAETTLHSYGISPTIASGPADKAMYAMEQALPRHHLNFLLKLQPFYVCGDYLFVHAGLRPNVALSRQNMDDFLTIRAPFHKHEGSFGFMVVHGHTPVKEPDIKSNRINIDTGAYMTGRLTCLVLEGDEAFLLKN